MRRSWKAGGGAIMSSGGLPIRGNPLTLEGALALKTLAQERGHVTLELWALVHMNEVPLALRSLTWCAVFSDA